MTIWGAAVCNKCNKFKNTPAKIKTKQIFTSITGNSPLNTFKNMTCLFLSALCISYVSFLRPTYSIKASRVFFVKTCLRNVVLFCSLGPILWGPICAFQGGMPGMAALQHRHITWDMPGNKWETDWCTKVNIKECWWHFLHFLTLVPDLHADKITTDYIIKKIFVILDAGAGFVCCFQSFIIIFILSPGAFGLCKWMHGVCILIVQYIVLYYTFSVL